MSGRVIEQDELAVAEQEVIRAPSRREELARAVAAGRLRQGRLKATEYVPGLIGWLGLGLVVLMFGIAAFAPVVAPYAPSAQDVAGSLAPPFWEHGGSTAHLLGTDDLGRDLLSRIVYGLRTSLLISLAAVGLATVVGVAVGLLAGYFGGWRESVLMRLTDVQMAFPFIILAVALLAVLPPTPLVIIVVISLALWPGYARVMRSFVAVQTRSDYVVALRALGASGGRIIVRYLLRDMMLPILVFVTLDIATMIIAEALLSFLGIGIQPPTASLGNVMADGKNYLVLGAWWISTLPGAAIFLTVLGLNLLGDSLQAGLDRRVQR